MPPNGAWNIDTCPPANVRLAPVERLQQPSQQPGQAGLLREGQAHKHPPMGRVYSAAATSICIPSSLGRLLGRALGAQAGQAHIRELVIEAGFTRFRRDGTPFNFVEQAKAKEFRRPPLGAEGPTGSGRRDPPITHAAFFGTSSTCACGRRTAATAIPKPTTEIRPATSKAVLKPAVVARANAACVSGAVGS